MNGGAAELTFAERGGRTVLVHSSVRAPMTVVRPFPLGGGRQLVQLITVGPGLCGGDAVDIRISVESGAAAVVTTPAAGRILSMADGLVATQTVDIRVAADATLEYYPAVTIPFPGSAFQQTISVHADSGSRVGVLETWALGRTARGEYLRFRSLSSRTSVEIDGSLVYAEATELRPGAELLGRAGVLAGRRYLASGFWHGVTLPADEAGAVDDADLVLALAQSRPGIAFLRALGSDAPGLDAAIQRATDRIAAAWNRPPVRLDRFRC